MQSTLGDRLRILRHEHHLTQEEVSKYLNVQRQSYSHYENNQRMPSLEMLLRLTQFYNISFLTLLFGPSSSHELEEGKWNLVPLNASEEELVRVFRGLPPQYQTDILEYLSYKKYRADQTTNAV